MMEVGQRHAHLRSGKTGAQKSWHSQIREVVVAKSSETCSTRRGFTLVGTYHEQGLLDGSWVDVVLMEKILE